MRTTGVHHIVLNVSDLEQSRHFYGDLLGFQLRTLPSEFPGTFAGSHFFILNGVEVFLVAHKQNTPGDRFSEFRLGLDHLAFGAPDEAALQELADQLKAAGVPTNGVETFAPTGNRYVSFRDPDNIQLECWLDKKPD